MLSSDSRSPVNIWDKGRQVAARLHSAPYTGSDTAALTHLVQPGVDSSGVTVASLLLASPGKQEVGRDSVCLESPLI